MGRKKEERAEDSVASVSDRRDAGERKMKPSEWAKEDRIDPHLFLWYDEHEGLVAHERYKEIKTKVYG